MAFKKLSRRVRQILGRETLSDRQHRAVRDWRKQRGDQTLRLDYPLGPDSLVWDLGGYHGDFAHDMFERYGCHACIFEPLPQYHEQCVARFRGNPKIRCFNFGLSDVDGVFDISEAADGSSFIKAGTGAATTRASLRPVTAVYDELGRPDIDLLKINIEGGEYQVLPALIDADILRRIRFVQVQFHTFVDDAESQRNRIRDALAKTHRQMWCFDFIWESWVRKEP